jgi:hypothetical protein
MDRPAAAAAAAARPLPLWLPLPAVLNMPLRMPHPKVAHGYSGAFHPGEIH